MLEGNGTLCSAAPEQTHTSLFLLVENIKLMFYVIINANDGFKVDGDDLAQRSSVGF